MQSSIPPMRKKTLVRERLLRRLLTTYTWLLFDIQVEQELWHTLCVSITLTWRSQCVNCSQLWTLLIIFVHLQKIAPIKEMFLMLWAISFSLICLRLICMYYAAHFMTGLNTKWTWYFQTCSSVCLQVRNCEKWYCGVGSVFSPFSST